jgi:GTP-dependent phosphoenolpyruvate carboxykinase
VPREEWRHEAEAIGAFFAKFDGRLPGELARQREALAKRVG